MTVSTTVQPMIHPSWKRLLEPLFFSPWFANLKQTLLHERQKFTIFPPGKDIFKAFDLCPVEKVKVVIIGQDPYHNDGQAHGLCFSVPENIPFPPSLLNIFKELQSDLGIPKPQSGSLEPWAKQGVLLINASLSVRAHQANSHAGIGWHQFTDGVIKLLSNKREGIIFLLWGSFARKKKELIAPNKGHHILEAPHPSPLSAHRGFFGCKHFSKVNEILKLRGDKEIDWKL